MSNYYNRESLIEQQVEIEKLKSERDELAAQVEALKSVMKQGNKEKLIAVEKQRAAEILLKQAIKVPVSYKGLIPLMVYDYDASLKAELNSYLSMSEDSWTKHLTEVRAEAGRAGLQPLRDEWEKKDAHEVSTEEKLDRLVAMLYKSTETI